MPRLNWKQCFNSYKMKKNQFGCLSRKKLFSVVLVNKYSRHLYLDLGQNNPGYYSDSVEFLR